MTDNNAEAGPSRLRMDSNTSIVRDEATTDPLRNVDETSGPMKNDIPVSQSNEAIKHPLSERTMRESGEQPSSAAQAQDKDEHVASPSSERVRPRASGEGQPQARPPTNNNPDLVALRNAWQQHRATRQQASEEHFRMNWHPPNEAMMVRRNMVRNSWQSFRNLSRWSRAIYLLRLGSGLAQLAVGIAILSLPTSLGDSNSTPETCDPEGMFIYLFLHTARIFASLPVDFYLGLSPHRSARSRRPDSTGHAERERTRRIGSLHLDRRVARLGDLLTFFHIILFIFGNYIVWTNTSCSHRPADSIPLFYTCVAMLSITYLIIFEVALILFLVIFFLPVLIAVMSALGLSHRLPQRRIHPDTDKISQEAIEKHSKLVYYTADLSSDGEDAENADVNASDDQVKPEVQDSEISIESPAKARSDPALAVTTDSEAGIADASKADGAASAKQQTAPHANRAAVSKRFLRAFGWRRRVDAKKAEDTQKAGGADLENQKQYKYPLHPIPAHRATCPICLCDYEEISAMQTAESDKPARIANSSEDASNDAEPEPLRLLECGHAMHRSCVDQWLTTVSGRCPVCQRPLLRSSKGTDDANADADGGNARDDILGFNASDV